MKCTDVSVRPPLFGRTERRVITVLALATGVLVTIEFAAVGLLPQLAVDLAVSIQRAGDLISVFALTAAILGPVLTLFSTRWPAPGFLAFCVLVFGVGNIVTSLWPSYDVMLVTRALQGAFIAPFIGVASTLLSSHTLPGKAGRAIGQMNIGTIVGTVFAVPAVVALADRFGWQSVTMFTGALALLVAPVVAHDLRGLPPVPATPWRRQLAILQRFRFVAHLGISVLLFASMFVSYSYIAALLEGPLALSRSSVAVAMCVFGIAGIAGNHVASNLVGQRPLALTNVIAAFLVVIGAAMTVFIGNRLVALALLLPWGAAYTAAFVTCQVRVMFAAQDAPAFAASLNIAACNLGIAIGAFIGGWVVEQFGVAGVGLAAGMVGLGALTLGVLLIFSPASGAEGAKWSSTVDN